MGHLNGSLIMPHSRLWPEWLGEVEKTVVMRGEVIPFSCVCVHVSPSEACANEGRCLNVRQVKNGLTGLFFLWAGRRGGGGLLSDRNAGPPPGATICHTACMALLPVQAPPFLMAKPGPFPLSDSKQGSKKP